MRNSVSAYRVALALGAMLVLGAGMNSAAQPTLSITDNNYAQATKDFSVPVGTTLTNTVTWVATGLEGRSGLLFLRFDTAPTVELLPADLTVTHAGTPVPAIKVGFNSIEYHVTTIPDLGTGGTISYSVTFNRALDLNNSRIGIHASGQPFVASNELSHQITVGMPPPPPPPPTLSITDNNYAQAMKDFSVPVGTTLTNTVTWVATGLEGRSGLLFLRFDTAPTVELLPADLTVTHAGTPVPAIKVGFNSIEYHVTTIPGLGTGGTIAYSVTFNKEMEVNNSRIGIHALGAPFVASNEISHQITVGMPVPPPPPPTLSISDNDYEQGMKDFSVPVGTTLTNTVTWVATGLEGRSGLLFLRFDTASTVELLPADLTVTFAGSPVPATKVGFSSIEYHVTTIPGLGTEGTIAYSVTFNKILELNNSRIGIHALGQPFVASNELSHQITVTPPAIKGIQIDIKPGSDPNAVNPAARGLIPVAILTTESFDALTVSPSTVQFGPAGASMAHRSGHLEDVDSDGDLDLVLHFGTQETGIQCGDTQALLTGETFDGQAIQGSDSIVTVGCG